ncbi:MAG TPA: hypothetical protein VHG89_09760 [Verrucomicrobiae bacterium]|nr:hypothetical protein [Verrucomicrobiae bacterium]
MLKIRQFVILTVWSLSPVSLAAQNNVVSPPLPPLDSVIQRAVTEANHEADQDRSFKQHYSYTRTRVTEYRNTDGNLKDREQKTDSNQPDAARATTRQSVQHHDSTAQSTGATIQGDTVHGKVFSRNDFLLNPDLLNRFQITLAGRETINGRPALMVDFAPKSGNLPESSIKDRFINRAAGRIWVDETDYAMVKADLHLTQKVNVLGGLVGAVWKFNYSFERERTDDGLWFVRNVNWHLEGRAVVLHRVVDYHEQLTDVRKTK